MVGMQFEQGGLSSEKKILDEVYTDENDVDAEEIVKDWDDVEEGKVRRK